MIQKYMMATKASIGHASGKLIDLSRQDPDLIWVQREDGDSWVGHWVEGFGFIDVYFPKATTRPCTAQEKKHYLACRLEIPSVGRIRMQEDQFA